MDREKTYREYCFKYGVLTLCYLMKEYESIQEYEECQIILNAINKLSEKFDMYLPTIFDDKAKRWLDIQLITMTETNGVTLVGNIPYYAEQIMNEFPIY